MVDQGFQTPRYVMSILRGFIVPRVFQSLVELFGHEVVS